MSRLLVLVDGSPQAGLAFERALQLKKKEDHLYIVHAVEYLTPVVYAGSVAVSAGSFDDVNEQLKAQGKDICKRYAHIAKEQHTENVETVLLLANDENPKDAVVTFAEKHDIDMIVVGTRGMGAVKRFFVGSFSNHIVNHAPCSVLVVKTDHHDDGKHDSQESKRQKGQ